MGTQQSHGGYLRVKGSGALWYGMIGMIAGKWLSTELFEFLLLLNWFLTSDEVGLVWSQGCALQQQLEPLHTYTLWTQCKHSSHEEAHVRSPVVYANGASVPLLMSKIT